MNSNTLVDLDNEAYIRIFTEKYNSDFLKAQVQKLEHIFCEPMWESEQAQAFLASWSEDHRPRQILKEVVQQKRSTIGSSPRAIFTEESVNTLVNKWFRDASSEVLKKPQRRINIIIRTELLFEVPVGTFIKDKSILVQGIPYVPEYEKNQISSEMPLPTSDVQSETSMAGAQNKTSFESILINKRLWITGGLFANFVLIFAAIYLSTSSSSEQDVPHSNSRIEPQISITQTCSGGGCEQISVSQGITEITSKNDGTQVEELKDEQ